MASGTVKVISAAVTPPSASARTTLHERLARLGPDHRDDPAVEDALQRRLAAHRVLPRLV